MAMAMVQKTLVRLLPIVIAALPLAAETPAARRLDELFAVVATGDRARIQGYVRDAFSAELRAREEAIVDSYVALHQRSGGFEKGTTRTTETEAAALLRSELTGVWETLSVRVEPEPPHRIVGPASLELKPPMHPLSRAGASDAARVREIARIATALAGAKTFSGTVLVGRGDKVLYTGHFGSGIGDGTRHNLASISKTFTTLAIALLVEQGKLSWDDPIGKFFPDFPPAEARAKVRIRHLVTHTSGLQDTLRYCERNRCPETHPSIDSYVRVAAAAQGPSLLYEPGSRYAYTNANFSLLGAIVEQLTGEPFYEVVRRSVFRPARMNSTGFGRSGRSYPAPFCCAESTARDLFRYARALQGGKIVRPETVRVLFSPKPEAGTWGYGFDILDEERGIVGHSGSWTNVSNSVDLFTRSGYTVVILSNRTNGRIPLREAIRTILP